MINDYVTFTQIAFRMASVYQIHDCVCVLVCVYILESLFIYRPNTKGHFPPPGA